MTLSEELLALAEEFSVRALSSRAAHVRALADRAEAIEKDAERYRWLRDAKYTDGPVGSLVEVWLFSRPTASGEGIDAAIDAAMKDSHD